MTCNALALPLACFNSRTRKGATGSDVRGQVQESLFQLTHP